MAVEPIIPPEWPFIYTLAVGQDWPQADEDALRRVAQAWTDALAGLVQISDHGQRATDDVHYSVQSITTDQFDEYWKQYTTGDDSAVGQLARQCQAVAEMLLDFADQTEFTKLSIDIQIVLLLIQVTYDLVIAPLTGGLSMGEAFAAMFFTRTIVRELISRIVEMVIFASVPDLITQSIMVAEGRRDSIDMHELGQAAQMGAIGGALAFGAGRVLGRYTPGLTKALGPRAGGMVRAGLTGGFANLGTVTAVNAVDAWEDRDDPNKQFGFADQKAGQNPLAVIANGVFTGLLFHGLHEISARPTVHFQTDLGAYTGVQTGDDTYTLFPESGGERGKMQLATLGDDGVLSIRRGIGVSYEATPTEVSLSDHGTTVHAVFTDGVPKVTSIEQVATGHEPSTFTHDGRVWTIPKGSVITFTPRDNAYAIRTPEGPVYAGGGDGSLSLVGRITTDPSGAVQHYLPGSPAPVTPEQFHAAVAQAQHALPASAVEVHAGPDGVVAPPPLVGADAPSTVHTTGGHAAPGHTDAAPVAFDDPTSRQVTLPEAYADLHGRVQRTPAGMGGYHADDEPMWRAAHAFERVPGRFLVDMHGNADGVRVGDRPLTAPELADLIRAAGWNGRDAIVLLACDTATGPSPYADALSRALGGAEVLAANASVAQDPARAEVALGRREWNATLQAYADASDGTERWFAFHGDGHPTEVGTDHSGLPDPSSHETHHVNLDLTDPDLVARAVEDPPPDLDDDVGKLVRALNVRVNRALLDLSIDLLNGVSRKHVQDLLDARQQFGLAAMKPRFPDAGPVAPREMYSTLVEVAVRRANTNLASLIDEDLREYLEWAAVAGDAERLIVGDTVSVGRYADLPPLEIKDTFPIPDLTAYRPEAYYDYLMGEAVDGYFDPREFVALRENRNTDWQREFEKYIAGKRDPDGIRKAVHDRLEREYADAVGPRDPRFVITHLSGMNGHTYTDIVTKLGKIQAKYGLSHQQIATAIHQVMLGDIEPMSDWPAKGGRPTVIKERNLMADLGRLVLVVEGSRHPPAMLTNTMNLIVGMRGGLKVPEFLKSYNSMMNKGSNAAAARLETTLGTADQASLTTLEDVLGVKQAPKLDAAMMQIERASVAAYLRELLKAPPPEMGPLAIGADPMTAEVLDHLRNGRVSDALAVLEQPGNLKLFLHSILAEVITYTTTAPRPSGTS